MLFGNLTRSIVLPLSLIAVLIGQVSRDETIQITYPTTGTVIDTNFVDATFSITDFLILVRQDVQIVMVILKFLLMPALLIQFIAKMH